MVVSLAFDYLNASEVTLNDKGETNWLTDIDKT